MKKVNIVCLILIVVILFFPYHLSSQNFKNIKLYLWDNDYGATFENPDRAGQYIGYEYNVAKALNFLGYTTNVNLFICETLPTRFEQLRNYQALFIITGHYPILSRDQMFTSQEVGLMAAYLDSGGCIYFEGNNFMEYLQHYFRSFVYAYFNDTTITSIPSRGIDTLRTDPAYNFTRDFTFTYPAYSVSDSGVDFLFTNNTGLTEPNYYKVLYFNSSNKLYRSTATAYTPPESKKYYRGRIFLQTVDLGAFSYFSTRTSRNLPDSTKNQIVRAAYLKDVLRFFGFAKTLLVVDDKTDTIATPVQRALSRMVDFDTIFVSTNGPSYRTLLKYNSVFWYTDTVDYPITTTDTVNISTFLDFGGNLFMSSLNLAEQYGTGNLFLKKYFGIDLYSDSQPYYTFYGSLNSFWGTNPVLDTFNIIRPSIGYEPDVVSIVDSFTDTAFYIRTLRIAGTHLDNNLFRTTFLTFPFQRAQTQIKAGYPTDSIIKIALVNGFKYDLSITPITSRISEYFFTSSFDKEQNKILLTIISNAYFEGSLTILKNSVEIQYEKISGTSFKFYLKDEPGEYLIILKDLKGETVYKKSFIVENQISNFDYSLNGLLKINSLQKTVIEVFDISGKKLKSFKLSEGENLVDFSDFHSGYYFIKYDDKIHKILKL
ncbi:MAG: T9SS type A sorting domain-containing protein [candidate division WOR-3 bacterium]